MNVEKYDVSAEPVNACQGEGQQVKVAWEDGTSARCLMREKLTGDDLFKYTQQQMRTQYC